MVKPTQVALIAALAVAVSGCTQPPARSVSVPPVRPSPQICALNVEESFKSFAETPPDLRVMLSQIMADRDAFYYETDAISFSWPKSFFQRFSQGGRTANRYVVVYEVGGMAPHMRVGLLDTESLESIALAWGNQDAPCETANLLLRDPASPLLRLPPLHK